MSNYEIIMALTALDTQDYMLDGVEDDNSQIRCWRDGQDVVLYDLETGDITRL